MTVLVGIKCRDGIVIGSDSSATFGSGQLHTIEQQTKKIEILQDKIIIAGTGAVGLGQRFCNQIDRAYGSGQFKGLSAIDMSSKMSALGINDFRSTGAPIGQYGSLVAYPADKDIHLCEFAVADFQPEHKTPYMWYASMGGGQMIADPFLGLMRNVYWQDGMPNLQDGIFIATWAIQHAIDVNAGGVGGAIQMAVLTNTSSQVAARFLTEDELIEHRENVSGAMQHLKNYINRDAVSDVNIADIPMPPSSLAQ